MALVDSILIDFFPVTSGQTSKKGTQPVEIIEIVPIVNGK
jgi:hypothetical protein